VWRDDREVKGVVRNTVQMDTYIESCVLRTLRRTFTVDGDVIVQQVSDERRQG